MREAVRDCVQRSGQCAPLPQFCPSSACISHTVSWADVTPHSAVQRGCSYSSASTPFAHLSQPRCLKLTSVQETDDVVDGVVLLDTSDNDKFDLCHSWTEEEPCDNKVVSVRSTADLTDSKLSLVPGPCEGEDGVTIEMVEASDQLTPTNLYFDYKAIPNQAVFLSESKKCFRIKNSLCGPDSVSFFADKKNLVMTNCNGSVLMRSEHDHCGSTSLCTYNLSV